MLHDVCACSLRSFYRFFSPNASSKAMVQSIPSSGTSGFCTTTQRSKSAYRRRHPRTTWIAGETMTSRTSSLQFTGNVDSLMETPKGLLVDVFIIAACWPKDETVRSASPLRHRPPGLQAASKTSSKPSHKESSWQKRETRRPW